MKEVYMGKGTYIEYETTKKSITFGDEDLTINLKNMEMDEKRTVDICEDRYGTLYSSPAGADKYVAQVEIPAREYASEETEDGSTLVPVPFDINKCTIYLWPID